MSELKLCRNCKYSRIGLFGWEYANCVYSTESKSIDLVTGKKVKNKSTRYCTVSRKYSNLDDYCGQDARHFEENVSIMHGLLSWLKKLP